MPVPARPVRDTRARLVAGGGAVALAALLGACSGGSSPASPPVTSGPGTTAPATTTSLQAAAGGPATACAPLDPAVLATRDLAVEARAVSADDGTVVLDVVRDYRGSAGGRVEVPQGTAGQPSEVSPGVFEVGRTYLVAAHDGTVSTCGETGTATPELRAVYDAAFPA